MISIIITTCASAAGVAPRYAQRCYALRNLILPHYVEQLDAEVIVAGAWTPELDAPYTTIQLVGTHGNVLDALLQRQAALQHAHGDLLWFQSDDHCVFEDFRHLVPLMTDTDVLAADRWTRLRGFAERVNNGSADGYASFHGVCYRRAVLAKVPWTAALTGGPAATDVRHSRLVTEAGFRLTHSETFRVWDVELGGTPWQ